MSRYAMSGTCGACSRFDWDENEYHKGYCDRYHSWYYSDDTCSYQDEDSSLVSSGGCFLTTACCEYKGLPDDCEQLAVLRNFRDTVLKYQPRGAALIAEYYTIAPGMVKRIEASNRKEQILEFIYAEVNRIVEMVKEGKNETATEAYVDMVHAVAKQLDLDPDS